MTESLGERVPPPGADPLVVEVTRGAAVESRHRVRAAIAEAGGAIVASWGDAADAVYPRSAIKPIQALPLIESGAALAFGLSDAEVALACASHSGESIHVAAVRAWLRRLGLSEGDLACGAELPKYEPAAHELIRAGRSPTPVHNNCSGKHAGMLTTARHLGEEVRGYETPEHPVQRRIAACIAEMTGCDLRRAAVGVDGCGIPTIAVPLSGLARAMARLAAPAAEAPARAEACRRVAAAMAAHPLLVAGTGRCGTALIEAGGGAVLAKSGAEGVYMAALPERGLGLALKVEDGAGRAAEVALLALLGHLEVLDAHQLARLAAYVEAPVLNRRSVAVGSVRLGRGA